MKKRILIIDDEPHFTIGVQSNLESTGNYQVEVVNDASEAVDRIRELKPDLILLDIVMPKVEGADIMDAMKEDPELRDIPVLVVTAMIGPDDAPDRDGVVKFGDRTLIAKPVTTETLIRCIEEQFSGKIEPQSQE
ncbi:MAG: CheY-like chemotaxis protein [Verrucomicrobiales bacterium]|jgi:CheY-like chemotaxis protein